MLVLVECFSSTYCPYFSSVSCSKEFPPSDPSVLHKNHTVLCVFGVHVCVREMVLLTCFIFILNVDNMIVWSAEFINLLQVCPHIPPIT